MGWFQKSVDKGVAKAIEKAFETGALVDQQVSRIMADHLTKLATEASRAEGDLSPLQFVWQMAFELIRVGRLDPFDARDKAVECLRLFLADEKIRFGDAAFAWDQQAAITLARDLEVEHWEAAA